MKVVNRSHAKKEELHYIRNNSFNAWRLWSKGKDGAKADDRADRDK